MATASLLVLMALRSGMFTMQRAIVVGTAVQKDIPWLTYWNGMLRANLSLDRLKRLERR